METSQMLLFQNIYNTQINLRMENIYKRNLIDNSVLSIQENQQKPTTLK